MTDLLDGIGPDLYRTNAFRVTGLPVGATTRDLRRQSERMRAAERYGVSTAASDAPALLPLPRPPEESEVREIAQRLRDPAKRLIDELFWFWPDGDADDPAMAALRDGDVAEAERLWDERDTPAGRHNLAVLAHARVLDAGTPDIEQWAVALLRWYWVYTDDAFWDLFDERVAELDDPRLTRATARGVRRDLPAKLLSINAELAVRAYREDREQDGTVHHSVLTASSFDPDTIGDVLRQAVRSDRDRITELCDAAERAIDVDAGNAGDTGTDLVGQTIDPLYMLRVMLDDDDPARCGAEDRVAHQVMRCAVTYGNRTGDWPTARELLAAAQHTAAGEATRADITRNLAIADDNVRGAMCLFCAKPASERSSLFRPVHGNVSYEWGRVTWQRATVPIPRCAGCAARHAKRSSLFVLSCAGVPAGCAFAIVFLGGDIILPGLLAAAIAVAAVILMCTTSPSGLTSEERTASYAYGPLRELIAQGWALGAKPPGVS